MPTVTYKDEREEEDRLIRDNENIENSGYHHHHRAAAAATVGWLDRPANDDADFSIG